MAQNIMKTSGRGSFFLWKVAGGVAPAAGSVPGVGPADVCAGGKTTAVEWRWERVWEGCGDYYERIT